MVDAIKSDFARLAKIYVANNGYPSIHLYTVDEALISFACRYFNARIVPHKGTTDVVISKRVDLYNAAKLLSTYRTGAPRIQALTLVKYCKHESLEGRRRTSKRLARQLSMDGF